MSLYTAFLSQAWFQSHLCPKVTLGESLPSGGLGSLPPLQMAARRGPPAGITMRITASAPARPAHQALCPKPAESYPAQAIASRTG